MPHPNPNQRQELEITYFEFSKTALNPDSFAIAGYCQLKKTSQANNTFVRLLSFGSPLRVKNIKNP